MLAVLLLAVPGIALLIFLQKKGASFAERIAARFFPKAKEGVSLPRRDRRPLQFPSRLAASSALHLLAWIGGGVGTFISFRLVGGHIRTVECGGAGGPALHLAQHRSTVPAAIGVQEAGYAMLAPLFGLPAEMGVAVSLLKRAREIVLGVPALIYWQSVEGRRAFAQCRGGVNV